jgi:predicted solute-binding protein
MAWYSIWNPVQRGRPVRVILKRQYDVDCQEIACTHNSVSSVGLLESLSGSSVGDGIGCLFRHKCRQIHRGSVMAVGAIES